MTDTATHCAAVRSLHSCPLVSLAPQSRRMLRLRLAAALLGERTTPVMRITAMYPPGSSDRQSEPSSGPCHWLQSHNCSLPLLRACRGRCGTFPLICSWHPFHSGGTAAGFVLLGPAAHAAGWASATRAPDSDSKAPAPVEHHQSSSSGLSGFIRAQGTQFVDANCKEFVFAGWNS